MTDPSGVFEFGPYRLDTRDRRLLASGTPVHLTPKAFDVLSVLVRQGGRLVTKQQLMDTVWQGTFVGDAALTRCVADLRKALGDTAGDGKYIDTVAKQGYRFVTPVCEVPVWPAGVTVVEESRTELVIEEERTEDRRTTRAGRWILPLAATALAVAGLAIVPYASRWSKALGATARPRVRSIAVLPFGGLRQPGVEEYLGLGITDALITRLSTTRDVAVRPTTAVRGFDASHTDALSAGRALGVEAVLEGTVQRDGNRIRVTVRMLNVTDGSARWAETFDEALDDLFTIEDSISRRVTDALAIDVLGAGHRLVQHDTSDPAAHRAYLEGRYFFSKRTREELLKAAKSLETAVAIDPKYALAHAGLADTYLLLSSWVPAHELVPKARIAAHTALELEPEMAEAHATLGLIAMNYDWEWAEAERQYRKAIEINPMYPTAHHWYGEYLAWMGRFDQGIAEVRRAEELDPISLIIKTDVGKILHIARRDDDAIAQLRRVLELDANYVPARATLAGIYGYDGRVDEARSVWMHPSVRPDDPNFVLTQGDVLRKEGRADDLRALHDRLIETSKHTYFTPYFLAGIHLLVGDYDQAIAAISRMCDERAPGVITLREEQMFDPLRSDPRFADLLKRAGLDQ